MEKIAGKGWGLNFSEERVSQAGISIAGAGVYKGKIGARAPAFRQSEVYFVIGVSV